MFQIHAKGSFTAASGSALSLISTCTVLKNSSFGSTGAVCGVLCSHQIDSLNRDLLTPYLHCVLTCIPMQVQFSPDGRWIVSASFDKSVKLWDGVKGTFVASFRGHVRPVYQVSWSSDSRLVVSGSSDSTLKVKQLLERFLENMVGCLWQLGQHIEANTSFEDIATQQN